MIPRLSARSRPPRPRAPTAPAPAKARGLRGRRRAPDRCSGAFRAATVVKTCALDKGERPRSRRAPDCKGGGNGAIPGVGRGHGRRNIPPNVALVFESPDATYAVVGGRSFKRPDVAEAFKNPVFVDSGFHANVSFCGDGAGLVHGQAVSGVDAGRRDGVRHRSSDHAELRLLPRLNAALDRVTDKCKKRPSPRGAHRPALIVSLGYTVCRACLPPRIARRLLAIHHGGYPVARRERSLPRGPGSVANR